MRGHRNSRELMTNRQTNSFKRDKKIIKEKKSRMLYHKDQMDREPYLQRFHDYSYIFN